jgi:hypothetical protein
MQELVNTDVFVICFETVGIEQAARLHTILSPEEVYMGAVQVDDSAKIHWALYSDCLGLSALP